MKMRRGKEFLRTLGIICLSLIFAIVVISIVSEDPISSLKAFFLGPFTNLYFFGNMLTLSIPLMFTGLGFSAGFVSGYFNLGLEGQVYFSSLVATILGLQLGENNPYLFILILPVLSFVVGGSVSMISGMLKIKHGISEVISSFLIGIILIHLANSLIEGPLLDENSPISATPYLPKDLSFPNFEAFGNLHLGILFAFCSILIMDVVLRRSVLGYEMKLVGKNELFSRYGGVKVERILMISAFLSGGFAGMAGTVDILGIHHRMVRGFSYGYGWNGIAVALISRNRPLFIIPASIFFAFLEVGSQMASIFGDMTPELSKMIQAVVFYLVTAESIFRFFKGRRR
ncbi:MAG: ABC transporter permease [Thermotoga sp.]|nr:MAG: ABC transporter permease [Thermotoga sp.]